MFLILESPHHQRRKTYPIVAFAGTQGFALVIALGLMAFVLLLMVSITALVRVETQSSEISISRLEAEQNAMLGLQIAMGELQQYTGSDTVVTASSEYIDGRSVLEPQPGGASAGTVQQKHWTGVWKVQKPTNDPNKRINRHLTWLVSGNEAVDPDVAAFQDDKGDGLTQTLLYSRPTADNTSGLAADHVWMVRSAATVTNNLNAATAEEKDRWVQVPKVSVGDSDAYAWWVADESVKARFNLGELPAGVANRDSLSYQLGQKTGFEGMGALAALSTDPNVRERYQSIFDLAAGNNAFVDIPKESFHRLTGVSQSLLTDTLRGGLRRDLSRALNSDTQFATMVADVGTGLGGRAIYDSADLDNDGTVTAGERTMGNAGGPLWDQLRSYTGITPDSGSGSSASYSVRPQRDDEHGILPIVTRAQIYFYASSFYSRPEPTAPDAVYQQGLRFWLLPTVVFWNPYNAEIRVEDETYFRFTNQFYLEKNGSDAGQNNIMYADRRSPTAILNPMEWNSRVNRWVFDGATEPPLTFRVEPFTLAPGETKVLSAIRNKPYANIAEGAGDSDSNLLRVNNAWTGGFGFYKDIPGFEVPENLNQTAGSNNPGSRNFVRIGNRNDTFQNWQWARDIDFAPEDYLISSQFHHWHGNHINFNASSAKISYYFEPPWDAYPAPPVTATWDPAYIWLSLEEFETTPLQSRYGGQSTINFDFPDHGYVTRARFTDPFIVGSASTTIGATQWLAQNNPRGDFTGRAPLDMLTDTSVSKSFFYNPNYIDRVYVDIFNNTPSNPQYQVDVNFSGQAYTGYADDANGVQGSIFFHLPRRNESPLSIAEWSQANLTRTHDFWAAADVHQDTTIYSRNIPNIYNNLQPAYAIGNSLIDPRIPSEDTFLYWSTAPANWPKPLPLPPNTDYSGINSVQYDHSYLLNEALYDRFFFSGISGTTLPNTLPNSRLIYLNDSTEAATQTDLADYRLSAKQLALNGGLNVNTVSVDAWRSLLRSVYDYDVQTLDGFEPSAGTAPFVRSMLPGGFAADAAAALSDQSNYTGYRRLSLTEIDQLADAIVAEYELRRPLVGPFLSLSDFVNRTPGGADGAGTRGLLQAALDKSVNSRFTADTAANRITDTDATGSIYTSDQIVGSAATGVPGYLTQADLLARIGPQLVARGDTFTIRSYGEAKNSVTGDTDATVWCEVIVQRLPEYIDPTDATELANPTSVVNQQFGRRYVLLSFRWLGAEDV